MSTPTTGAASELPIPESIWLHAIVSYSGHVAAQRIRDSARREFEATIAICEAAEAARTPAPVQVKPVDGGSASDSTKESSREAVAWVPTDELVRYQEGKLNRNPCVCFGANIWSMPSTPLYTAPPPPARVQSERGEAGEFMLLPRDPTGRMWAAFDDVCDVPRNLFRSGYKAMLAAAPAPPTDASGPS